MNISFRIQNVVKSGQNVDFYGLLNVAVVNTLWRMITGQVFDQDDPEIIELTMAFNKFVIVCTSLNFTGESLKSNLDWFKFHP